MTFAWELLFIGADVSMVYLMYDLYKRNTTEANAVETATSLSIDESLKSQLQVKGTEPYACIKGVVRACDQALESQHGKQIGVIRQNLLLEHRSRRNNGYWSDIKRVITDRTKTVPFNIAAGSDKLDVMVGVEEPLSARFLKDELEETFDHFEEAKANALIRGMDRLFGDVVSGTQETERMLTLGTHLLGIGKVTLENGQVKLLPPDRNPYILTTLSRNEIIKSLKSQARVFKVFGWLFALLGLGMFVWWSYRRFRLWRQQRASRAFFRQLELDRRAASQQRAQGAEANATGDDNIPVAEDRTCVVCLTNPREVVVLECGHVCLCGDCAQALPSPKKCPVCRSDVARFVTTYIA